LNPRLRLVLGLGTLLLAAPACKHDGNAVLLITVTASGTPPTVASLNVTLTSSSGQPSMNRYAHDGQTPISFPTTLSAEIPGPATGDITIDVRADDASGAAVASGHGGPITIHGGERRMVYVRLDCGGDACIIDGGAGNDDGGMSGPTPRCGNGHVDLDVGETCDTAIAPGDPGACPPASCDDHIPCTRDTANGSECTRVCTHVEITEAKNGDGCCPAGSSREGPAADNDCKATCGNGVVDKEETCDTAIQRGMIGACPTSNDCLPVPCADPAVISLGTCNAVCVHQPIILPSGTNPDTCCPPGATTSTDIDCPATCGNGVRDMGENCDVAIAPGAHDACAATCDDGKACTVDFFRGVGCARSRENCAHTEIKLPVSGDGCCPAGATNATDSDCAPVCGNGVVERGETCDGDSCPTKCPQAPPGIRGRRGCMINALVGDPAQCDVHCEVSQIKECNLYDSDDCCPEGCTSADDVDCSPLCGNGFRDLSANEECDTADGTTVEGTNKCRLVCFPKSCTDNYVISSGTCDARCVYLPVSAFRPGDGCCPAGGTSYLDSDCPAICGDGTVDRPGEMCDYGPSAGCPTAETCLSQDKCTTSTLTGRADTCGATCVVTPVTACISGDGCCAPGCTSDSDKDCPVVCGDGVVDTSENCDRAITAGAPGACARTCDDGNACTFDQASGSVEACSRTCSHTPITACVSDDGCCPAGCEASDADCAPRCKDGHIGAGETCDPPASCPTTCPDDGDPCTVEQMTGAADTCNAACRHVPIRACSGAKADSCCPTGCTASSDTDC
jgi:hypothetical protein